MKWNHLPVHGGVYDQHPQLLTEWMVIWEERAKYEAEKARKEKNAAKTPRVKR